jgi:hypothetical protein
VIGAASATNWPAAPDQDAEDRGDPVELDADRFDRRGAARPVVCGHHEHGAVAERQPCGQRERVVGKLAERVPDRTDGVVHRYQPADLGVDELHRCPLRG